MKEHLPDQYDRGCRDHERTEEKGSQNAFPRNVSLKDNCKPKRQHDRQRYSRDREEYRVLSGALESHVAEKLGVVFKPDEFLRDRIAYKRIVDHYRKRYYKEYHNAYKAWNNAGIAENSLSAPAALISGFVFHFITTLLRRKMP